MGRSRIVRFHSTLPFVPITCCQWLLTCGWGCAKLAAIRTIAPFSVFISATCISGDFSSGWAVLGESVLIPTTSVTRSSSTFSIGPKSCGR